MIKILLYQNLAFTIYGKTEKKPCKGNRFNLLLRTNLHAFREKKKIKSKLYMFRPSDSIALIFFFKKDVLGKIGLCCLRAAVPSCGIPFIKFLQEVLGNHKQKY